jgi:uncharacterized protein HI_1406|nr:MAG TPA: YjcQ protein [Caudoviricetes sp.]
MRLNADYVRDILLYIESNLNYDDLSNAHKEISHGKLLRDEHFANYDKQELTYALELLIKSGFVDLADKPNIQDGNIYIARIIGLTWTGHELLDNIRDNTVWDAVKKKAAKYSGLSISALFSGAKALGSALMTDPNAIQNFLDGVNNIGDML